MKVRYKKNRMVQFYESNYLTATPYEPPPILTGPQSHCEGCPYPGHGFVCGSGETCLRTEMIRIMERDKSVGSAE